MPTLDDLPPYRHARLLWEHAHFGVEGVYAMVLERAGEPCTLSGVPKPSVPRTAVLGTDGRYHLMSDGRMVCAATRSGQGWNHEQWCGWTVTDAGLVYGTVAGGRHDSLIHRWFVEAATAEGVPPASVSPEQRCLEGTYGAFHYWPPPPARTAVVRRFRALLIDDLGPDCHLCGALPGAMVDHDYATGMVRGFLCKFCNRTVEECPHVTGCPKAAYMDYPPAEHLLLRYPHHLAYEPSEASRRQKIALLGFDPLAEWRGGRCSPSRRFPWAGWPARCVCPMDLAVGLVGHGLAVADEQPAAPLIQARLAATPAVDAFLAGGCDDSDGVDLADVLGPRP
ncbi:endonuclease domain-containing protein [Streptomyces canus]|uniref:endonuclease domain-containing protein n=1 Tax=Streptomyces canus TaxID=58343 RepID=UPI002E37BAAC|nr:endonuclease domain-containing protein [Streptomyces canus]